MNRIRQFKWMLVLMLIGLIGLAIGPVMADPMIVGELVCQMETGVSIETVNQQFGTVTAQELPILNIYQLNVSGGQDLLELSAEIEAMSGVVFCHPNYLIDPLKGVQGSLPISDIAERADYLYQPAVDQVQVGSIQSVTTGNNVKVAILDGGAYLQHPEFSGRVVSGYDYVADDAVALDEPGGPNSGHGTFVAGVIRLIAPDVEIRAYRVTDIYGNSNGYIVAEAIMQAVADGCKVINLSMVTEAKHKAIAGALEYAWNHNVISVAAAGNGYTSESHYPASDEFAIGVAAVTSNLDLASFSSYGGHIDVCAPGVQICSPYLDNKYAWWEGTSFSAPFVTAQAALIWSIFPSATSQFVKDAIINTAIDIDYQNPGKEGLLGAGMIDLLASLDAAVCGDINQSGTVNLADLTRMLDYLYLSHAPLIDPFAADMDDWIGITPNDVARLTGYIYWTGPPLECNPTQSGRFPVSSGIVVEVLNYTVPAASTHWTVDLQITSDQPFDALAVPFVLGYTGPTYNVDSVVINPDLQAAGMMANFDDFDPTTNTGYFGANSITAPLPAGTYPIGQIYLSNVFGVGEADLVVDTATFSPGIVPYVSTDFGVSPVTPQFVGLGGDIDNDGDGYGYNEDNCPFMYNPDQADADGDGVGDLCDICVGDDKVDTDLDNVPNDCDNCPTIANADQSDLDGDGMGDVCDVCSTGDDSIDTDGDGRPDDCDNCPDFASLDQTDRDQDGIGDVCDPCVDVDGDGYGDPAFAGLTCPPDNCTGVVNPDQDDSDGDGWGDACDNCPDVYSTNHDDYDHDGVGDACDNCPGLYNPDQADLDENGVGDDCEVAGFNCGNVDDDPMAKVNLRDLTNLIDHLLLSRMDLPNPANADVDDWQGITFNDVASIAGYLFVTPYTPLDCNPSHLEAFPESADDTVKVSNLIIPAGNDSWEAEVWLYASEDWHAVSVPMTISCTNPNAVFDGLVREDTLNVLIWGEEMYGSGDGVLGVIPSLWQSGSAGWFRIGSFRFTNTGASIDHHISIVLNESAPPSNVPVLSLQAGLNPVRPVFAGFANTTDSDGDGLLDIDDNCYLVSNATQADGDGDGVGDACDLCAQLAGNSQLDDDGDGIGNECDVCPDDADNDSDGDGLCVASDNCPGVNNVDQTDSDGDGVGDACDQCAGQDDLANADLDMMPDSCDNCPTVANDNQVDSDGDGIGDLCDVCPNGDDSCESRCVLLGDFNQDLQKDPSDLFALIDYLYLSGTAPTNPLDADIDNYLGITIGDVITLRAELALAELGQTLARECPPTHNETPALDSSFKITFLAPIDPYSTSGEVPIMIDCSSPVYGFNLPMQLTIDGGVMPVIDSFVASTDFDNSEYLWEFTPGQVDRIDAGSSTILISGALQYDSSQPLLIGRHDIGTLYLSYSPSSAERNLNVSWNTLYPAQALPMDYIEVGLYPVVVVGTALPRAPLDAMADGIAEFAPILEASSSCCVDGYSGNTDCSPDGNRTLADITRLIDFVYLSKSPLCCDSEGNVDGDLERHVNLADITRLIDNVYISKGPTAVCE